MAPPVNPNAPAIQYTLPQRYELHHALHTLGRISRQRPQEITIANGHRCIVQGQPGNRSLYATRELRPGTCIIQQRELFHVFGPNPTGADVRGRIPNQPNAIFDALAPTPPRRRTDPDLRRFMVNRFPMTGNRYGIFPDASLINHSCVPNAHWVYNANLGMLTVYATRVINNMDQIIISYILDQLQEFPGYDERRDRLHTEWRFWCACEACGNRAIFDLKYQTLLQSVDRYEAAKWGTQLPNLRLTTRPLGNGPRATAMEMSFEHSVNIDLILLQCRELGMPYPMVAEFLSRHSVWHETQSRRLAPTSYNAQSWRLTCRHDAQNMERRALELAVAATGPDSDETLGTIRNIENLQ